MAYANNMSDLIDKIERRLGTRPLNLPDHLKKETWGKVIEKDTIMSFSRFYPHKMRYRLNANNCVFKDGYYYIDEEKFKGIKVLGVKDIAWETFGNDAHSNPAMNMYGYFDSFNQGYSMVDIAMVQMAANQSSLVNNNIFIDYEEPGRIKITNCFNVNITHSIKEFDVDLLIVHAPNLATIPPTMMETFEKLAIADIALYLYQELKHFDGLDTVYGNIDLKMAELETKAQQRDEIIELIEQNYVSADNQNQPIVISI